MIRTVPCPLLVVVILISCFAGHADAGGKFKSRKVRFKPCQLPPPCIDEFRLRGRFDEKGERDYFRFYNHLESTVLDLWVTARTKGTLPSGNGVKVNAYAAKKKGRRNVPSRLRELKKLARGNARLRPPRKDGAFATAFLPENRWIVICLTPRVRGEKGDYNIFFEREEGPEVP